MKPGPAYDDLYLERDAGDRAENARRLERTMALPVKIGLMSGSPGKERAKRRRFPGALSILVASDAVWELMDGWTERAVTRGRPGMTDLLIAAPAAEGDAPPRSLDPDFKCMQKPRFIRLHIPS